MARAFLTWQVEQQIEEMEVIISFLGSPAVGVGYECLGDAATGSRGARRKPKRTLDDVTGRSAHEADRPLGLRHRDIRCLNGVLS